MKRAAAHPPSLQRLSLRWRLFGMMLVAFARQVSLAHKMRAAAGLHKAEWLEAAIYAALVELSADTVAAAQMPSRSKADDEALAFLNRVHSLLGVMALLMRQFKADFTRAAEWWLGLSAGTAFTSEPAIGALLPGPDFLDSS